MKVVFGLGETYISSKRAPRAGEVHFLFLYALNTFLYKKNTSLVAVIPTTTTTTTTTRNQRPW